MTILDGMESETLATLAPVTKTIQAENVKVIGVDQVFEASRSVRFGFIMGFQLKTNWLLVDWP